MGPILQKRQRRLRVHKEATSHIPALPRLPAQALDPRTGLCPSVQKNNAASGRDCRAGRERPARPWSAEGKAKAIPAPELPDAGPLVQGVACHPLTPQTQPDARPRAAALYSGVLGIKSRSCFTAAACLGTRRFGARQTGGPGPGRDGPSTVPRYGICLGSQPASPGSRPSTAWVHPPETAPTGWLQGCQL